MKSKRTDDYRDVRIQVRITQEESEKIYKLAQKLKLTQASMIRNLLLVGLDSADFMNAFGILNLAMFFKENKIRPIEVLQLADSI